VMSPDQVADNAQPGEHRSNSTSPASLSRRRRIHDNPDQGATGTATDQSTDHFVSTLPPVMAATSGRGMRYCDRFDELLFRSRISV
jgi:hypothetical protein